MSKHIMIDLETWGTSDDAVITEIGAVAFTPGDTSAEPDEFHVCVSPIGQVQNFKRKIDEDTVMWWMNPERAEAWARWVNTLKFDLPTTLEGFQLWMERHDKDARVWGNGVGFDNVILRSAYHGTGQQVPWKWYNDRCFRTLKSLAPVQLKPSRAGTHHNALDDARHQVNWLQEIATFTNMIID